MPKRTIFTSKIIVLLLTSALMSPATDDHALAAIDLSLLQQTLIYESHFSNVLRMIDENDLFSNNVRIDLPANIDWIKEGQGRVWTDAAMLFIEPFSARFKPSELVLWNGNRFPKDIALDIQIARLMATQQDMSIFFAAAGEDNGGIFDVNQPLRAGYPDNYYFGSLNSYALRIKFEKTEAGHFELHRNLWQNYGKQQLAQNCIQHQNCSDGCSIQVLKYGSSIQVKIDERIALRWTNQTGSVLGDGFVGFGMPQQKKAIRMSNVCIRHLS